MKVDASVFFDISQYLNDLKPKTFIIGARGIGKTYSSLSYLVENKIPFVYMRNKEKEMIECSTDFGNPFKRLNRDKGWNIKMKREKDHSVILDYSGEVPEVIGYGCDLATFVDFKGADLSDTKVVYFDEFISLKKLQFDQFQAFTYMYETVNRSRELLGEDPLICICTSNSDSLANPILMGYNLVPIIEGMLRTGQRKCKINDIFVFRPTAKISELKANTDHYKSLKGTKVYKNAINNEFAYDSQYGIRKRKLIEYKPLVMIDDIYIYKHKSENLYYACSSQFTNMPEFTSKDNKISFYRSFGRYLSLAMAEGLLECSDFVIKTKLSQILL